MKKSCFISLSHPYPFSVQHLTVHAAVFAKIQVVANGRYLAVAGTGQHLSVGRHQSIPPACSLVAFAPGCFVYGRGINVFRLACHIAFLVAIVGFEIAQLATLISHVFHPTDQEIVNQIALQVILSEGVVCHLCRYAIV